MADYKSLLLTKEGSIAIVTINRPKHLNTLGPEVWVEIGQAADEVEAMEDRW